MIYDASSVPCGNRVRRRDGPGKSGRAASAQPFPYETPVERMLPAGAHFLLNSAGLPASHEPRLSPALNGEPIH